MPTITLIDVKLSIVDDAAETESRYEAPFPIEIDLFMSPKAIFIDHILEGDK